MAENSAATEDEQSMRVDPQRASHLAENLGSVFQRVQKSSSGRKVSDQLMSSGGSKGDRQWLIVDEDW